MKEPKAEGTGGRAATAAKAEAVAIEVEWQNNFLFRRDLRMSGI